MMPTINSLHLLDSLNRGGAETMMLDVCRNARDAGLNLTFVATGGGDLEEDFRTSGVEFIRLTRKLPVDFSVATQLRQIIKDRNIGVVHGHQPVDALHLFLATRRNNTKRVMTIHGVYPGTRNELALRFVAPRLDARVVVSSDLLRRLSEHGVGRGKNTVVIRNGVDPQRLKSAGRKLRDELGIGAEDLLLGMVGNFQPVAQKDQLTVCKALPQFFREVPNARFVFIGGKSDAAPHLFDECVKFCREHNLSERVHFLGKRSDIAEVLHSLDVFVLSTLREGSPISVIEAMLLEVPTVLSDIPALREVSDDGANAVLFRTGDAADLSAKLIGLARDHNTRTSLSSVAKTWANEQFGIKRHIGDLIQLYQSLYS